MTSPAATQSERDAVDLQVLRIARAYVAQDWCKGAMARTADGAETTPESPLAAQWSADGAIAAATHGITDQEPARWLGYLMLVIRKEYGIGQVSIPIWEEAPGRIRGEVLRMFDVAIRALEART